jgi:hypothetical protein
LAFQKIGNSKRQEHGTEIFVKQSTNSIISDELARTEIGMRFLSDPNFIVTVNSQKVTFSDIPKER